MHQTLSLEAETPRRSTWPLALAIPGTLWNLYGVYQFAGCFTAAGRAAMTAGLTDAQAAQYLALPGWITFAFGIGVAAGLAGSILLALRRRLAGPVLATSLAGYLLLFAGDAAYGVFATVPGQLALLGFVVFVAAVLWGAARLASRRHLMR